MKRRQTMALALAGIMGVSLTACGGGNSQGGSGNSSGGVTVAIWDNAQLPGLKAIMDDFTKESGIAVEIQVVPWDQYWLKVGKCQMYFGCILTIVRNL